VKGSYIALVVLVVLIAGILVGLRRNGRDEAPIDPPGPAIDLPPRGYVCYRASGPLVIDGKLDDSAWANAPWSESFRDIEGDLRPDPPLRTRMKMLWDDSALYIAADIQEPHVWGTITKHDAVIFHDNDFEVFINPDGDGHNYGEFEMNARNATWDLLLTKPYKDSGRAVDSWEIAGLKTGVQVDGTINDPRDVDRGWTVEIALPWKSLKELSHCPVPPRDGHQWRINFSRVEWDVDIVNGEYHKVPERPEHNWVWSPQGVIDMHRPERWGIVQFSSAKPGTAEFHSDPAQPARDYLHRIYYAQRAFHKKNHGFTSNLAGLNVGALPTGLSNPSIEATQNTFEASVDLRSAGGVRERWQITHDARFVKVGLPGELD
jgi:Carbohydrate family 9 binding domain-like